MKDLREKGLWILKPCTRRLMGLLSHKDPNVRCEAATALGNIGDPEAVTYLLEALTREKQDEQVALALAQIGDPFAIPLLLKAFNEADRYTRPNIALALSAFKDPQVLTTLISSLSDPDPNVRFNCISALGKLKDPQAVSPLLGCLSEANEWIFLNVVDALAKIGDHRATNPLIAFYSRESNERKRAAIITALGRIKDLTAVTILAKALRDHDDRVKANAIDAIRCLELPKDKTQSLIQPFVKHPNNRVRGNAIIALSSIQAIDPLSHLEAMASDPDKWTRATLGFVLTVISHPKAMPLILRLLKDEDTDVRKNAAKALAKKARDEETEILIRLLNDPLPYLRLQAVQTLGRLKSVPAVAALCKLFPHERHFKIRSSIISALGSIGDQGAVELLTQALKDLDSRVRANAVESLEKILGEKANPLIVPLLNDPDNRTRANAAKALFQNGDTTVITTLEDMLSDNEPAIKISAAYALGKIGLALKEAEESPLQTSLKISLDSIKLPQKCTMSTSTQSSTSPRDGNPPLTNVELEKNINNLRKAYLEAHSQGKYKDALEAVKTFLENFPNDIEGCLFAANLNYQLSRFDEAIRHFKKCIEIDPNNIQALANLAIACYKSNRIQEAIYYFKQALKIKPDLAHLQFNLANLFLKEGNWEEAIFHYEEGIKHHHPTPRVLANLGFAYQKIGQYEQACQFYQQAVESEPKEAGVYYNWALILMRQGKHNEARSVLEAALKHVPIGTAGLKAIREFLERLKQKIPS